MAANIENLRLPAGEEEIRQLAALLVDAVDSGAAVSFLAPLTMERAVEWWRGTLGGKKRPIVIVARDSEGIVGTVQLHPAWAPNQPHRADVAKLIVHRRSRHGGIGEMLMRAVEAEAGSAGFTLLTLDAKRGGAAERLYRRLGWVHAGTIPDYALDADGTGYHDTVVFYKRVERTSG